MQRTSWFHQYNLTETRKFLYYLLIINIIWILVGFLTVKEAQLLDKPAIVLLILGDTWGTVQPNLPDLILFYTD
jgi:hypothetical protein